MTSSLRKRENKQWTIASETGGGNGKKNDLDEVQLFCARN